MIPQTVIINKNTVKHLVFKNGIHVYVKKN